MFKVIELNKIEKIIQEQNYNLDVFKDFIFKNVKSRMSFNLMFIEIDLLLEACEIEEITNILKNLKSKFGDMFILDLK